MITQSKKRKKRKKRKTLEANDKRWLQTLIIPHMMQMSKKWTQFSAGNGNY